MDKNKIIIFGISFLLVVFLVNFVPAEEPNYCCEKTTSGAWCQNAPINECNSGFRKVPTSCEATAYCKLGTCINSQEGTCMENTPQKVCDDNNGVWENGEPDEIPQCGLGCCLIGDQAAYVTQTRCKRLASVYGLEIDYRTDINSETACIASISSEVKGACVFEKEFEKTCKFISKRECQAMSETEFHEGFLCSDEKLGTNCGPSEKTTCVEGRDEVYFEDTCGNLANIYDASRQSDKSYWSKVLGKDETCGFGEGNKKSATCGNCNYFLGSTCKAYKRGENVKPNYGDYICKDLDCEYNGVNYDHGETWCAGADGVSEISVSGTSVSSSGEDLPGGRYSRMVCYNGEVSVESCADFRNEVCIESSVNDFSTAACRVNKWQHCTSQNEKIDCENEDRRDCKWVTGNSIMKDSDGRGYIVKDGKLSARDVDDDGGVEEGEEATCLPRYAPGFNFWEDGDSEEICSSADKKCTIVYEKGLLSGKKCEENCDCEDEEAWENKMNDICIALGDCGIKKNYLGEWGYNSDKIAEYVDVNTQTDDNSGSSDDTTTTDDNSGSSDDTSTTDTTTDSDITGNVFLDY